MGFWGFAGLGFLRFRSSRVDKGLKVELFGYQHQGVVLGLVIRTTLQA